MSSAARAIAGLGASPIGRTFGTLGLGLLVILGFVAVLAPVIAPYDPAALVGPSLARPSAEFWLGTNDLGQDILSLLIHGARTSLWLGLAVAVIATGIGTAAGLAAGLARGATDAALMRLVDLILVVPFIPLLLVLQLFLGAGAGTLIAILSAVMWARPARELRAQVLSVREEGHVQAALAMGAGPAYVLVHHVLPDVTPLIIPQLVRIARGAILTEASLSFLGLGDPTQPSWGTMLFHAQARSAFLTDAWLWWILPPGIAIGAAVLGVALVGYALEEVTRPRIAGQWAPTADLGPSGRDGPEARRTGGGEIAPEPAGPEQGDEPIRVSGVEVAYGAAPALHHAVRGADLTVRRGEFVGLVGESGSGKTTLATAVLGLLRSPGRLVAGSVGVGGEELSSLGAEEARSLRGRVIALVPQNAMSALNPVHRVDDQIVEAIRAHRDVPTSEARARARDLMESVGIDRSRTTAYPHELSGGMQQRVLIAMALANEPAVLVADEPTTGLDHATRDGVLALLDRLRQEYHLGVLLITHDLDVVVRVADRVAVMHEGRVVEEGPPAELRARGEHAETRRLFAADIGREERRAEDGSSPEAPRAAAPVLTVTGLAKGFGTPGTATRLEVLRGVDLTVHEAEIVGLLGPSGAGKTTLARIIAGLERPDAGRIVFLGDDITTWRGAARRSVAARTHLVFQDPYDSLPGHMTVRGIVAEPLTIHRMAPRKEQPALVRAALDAVGLDTGLEDRFPHQLSGGERQRVALARAVIHEPRFIVTDEPTALLDAPLKAGILDLLRRLRDRYGTAVLLVTHDRLAAEAICDRIVVVRGGRLTEGT